MAVIDVTQKLLFNVGIEIFAIMIVAVLYYSLWNDFAESYDLRMLRKIEMHIMIILAVDILILLVNGESGLLIRVFLYAANVICFVLQQSIAVRWFCYAYYRIYGKNMDRRAEILMTIIPLSVMNTLAAASPFTGWCFSIDAANIYRRGPAETPLDVVALGYMFFSSWLALRQRRCERMVDRKKELLSIALFPIPVFIGGITQMMFYDYHLAMPCAAFSVLLLYANKCSREISQDFLTGLNNRGNLEHFLVSRVDPESREKTAMIILDVNLFKCINDNFGHDVGDQALVSTAEILKNTFRKSTAFLSRFGGDEFVVVMTDTTRRDTENACNSIKAGFDRINSRNKLPYELTVSMGYAISVLNTEADVHRLFKQADKEMYAGKELWHIKHNNAIPVHTGV